MFILTCDITIGDYRFNQVHDVKIEKSWRNLDDKATLKLPRSNKLLEKNIKVGDPVSITLAYDGVYSGVEFEGYVKKVKPKVPLEIECEDATWLLRQTRIKEDLAKPLTLESAMQQIIDQVNAQGNGQRIELDKQIPKVELEGLNLKDKSAAEAINRIKESYGLSAYFLGHSIYIGLAYRPVETRVNYHMDRNVIKNDLTYRRAEDIKVKVKVILIANDNTQRSEEVGDPDGDQRTIYHYNLNKNQTLKEFAKTKLDELKYDGFEGNITTFLIPHAVPGMTAVLRDPDHPGEHDGSYVIDSVTTTFGMRGARRKVELGALIAKGSDTNTNNP